MSVWEWTKAGLRYTSPGAWLIAEGLEKASKDIARASSEGMKQLEEEAAKKSLELQFAQEGARVEQELAIARRIDLADEVEIEEFYDTLGKGSVGITGDAKKEVISAGLSGEARRVTKRVYHFKGWRAPNPSSGEG